MLHDMIDNVFAIGNMDEPRATVAVMMDVVKYSKDL